MVGDLSGMGACVNYASRRIRRKEKRQGADVRGWKWYARDVVVCWRGLKNCGKAAFVASNVLVQLGLCAKMIDAILQFFRGGFPRVGFGGGQFVREVGSVKRVRETRYMATPQRPISSIFRRSKLPAAMHALYAAFSQRLMFSVRLFALSCVPMDYGAWQDADFELGGSKNTCLDLSIT